MIYYAITYKNVNGFINNVIGRDNDKNNILPSKLMLKVMIHESFFQKLECASINSKTYRPSESMWN